MWQWRVDLRWHAPGLSGLWADYRLPTRLSRQWILASPTAEWWAAVLQRHDVRGTSTRNASFVVVSVPPESNVGAPREPGGHVCALDEQWVTHLSAPRGWHLGCWWRRIQLMQRFLVEVEPIPQRVARVQLWHGASIHLRSVTETLVVSSMASVKWNTRKNYWSSLKRSWGSCMNSTRQTTTSLEKLRNAINFGNNFLSWSKQHMTRRDWSLQMSANAKVSNTDNKLCGRLPQYDSAPSSWPLTYFYLESGVRVTCNVCHPGANF